MKPSSDRAAAVVAWMARQLRDGDVVATGVASPLAILAIALARATHAPNLAYISCVGALDPAIDRLLASSEDLAYLEGRSAEVTIPDLFDLARRGRIDVVFFGAAEIDGKGATNMTALGGLRQPTAKLPGLAGAASLRRWVKRPVVVVPRHTRKTLVPAVQVVSTVDPRRATTLLTNLAVFEVGAGGARLVARHPWTTADELEAMTGFRYTADADVTVTEPPDDRSLCEIERLDPLELRRRLVA